MYIFFVFFLFLRKVASTLTASELEIFVYAATAHAKRVAKQPGGLLGLTPDMAAAIHAYTQESMFYKNLNAFLRDRAREKLKPFFPYLKLLLSGLRRLKAEKCTLYVATLNCLLLVATC